LLADLSLTIVSPEAGGSVVLSLNFATLNSFTAKEGFFDVLLAAAGDDPHRYCHGRIVFGDGETVWP
jgi:hypothetical protein